MAKPLSKSKIVAHLAEKVGTSKKVAALFFDELFKLAVKEAKGGAGTRLVNKYNLFVPEVLKAWADPAQKDSKTIHHHGYGRFAVDGEMIELKTRMR